MSGSPTVHGIRLPALDGGEIDLDAFRGRRMLIVNTASACGFTAQYAQLQELHELFRDKVAVLGCPSNDFGNQEPRDDREIREFCSTNYGVSFPMSRKIRVTGPDRHPLFERLAEPPGEAPRWNFTKYVVDEEGRLTHVFGATEEPLSDAVRSAIGLD